MRKNVSSLRTLLLMMMVLIGSGCNSERDVTLRCATFNIGRDNGMADAPNHWAGRRDRVCQFVTDNQIDIVGMQEVVLPSQSLDISASLPQYETIGVGRDEDKQGEAVSIFYRKDKFEVLDSNTFWLSENPEAVGKSGWDAAFPRVATWARFKDLASGKVFFVMNTHFDHVGVEARNNSALLLIDKIKELAKDEPVILMGDFNVTDTSEPYHTLTTNEFVLIDAHKVAEKVEGVNYSFHDFADIPPEDCNKIDFIFTTPQIKVKYSEVFAEVPGACLSDHNPQAVELVF